MAEDLPKGSESNRINADQDLERQFVVGGHGCAPCLLIKLTNDEARMAEISENLHRSDLTKLEPDDMVAEWISRSERDNAAQNAPHRKAGQQPVVKHFPNAPAFGSLHTD